MRAVVAIAAAEDLGVGFGRRVHLKIYHFGHVPPLLSGTEALETCISGREEQ